MTDLAEDAALAADLVREAGLMAQELREAGLEVDAKSSVSDVVTAADRAAERLIVDHLAAFRPDDGVLGEEGTERASGSGRTWIVDPVDGTYNFVHDLDWWCSAVALVEDGAGVVGAVYHPGRDTLYVGGPHVPTTRDGKPVGPLADVALADTCVSTYLHPPFFDSVVGETFVRVVQGAATLRMLGSGSMDLATVAQGRLGVFVQHSVAPWDWWPGASLVLGAGGDARQLTRDGKVWSVAGARTAVAEACALIEDVSG